jgi:alkyldihydroxyacetonephosphate synthase
VTRDALAVAFPKLRVSDRDVDRLSYGRDLWPRHHLAVREGDVSLHRPASIVWPERTEDVAEIVRFCEREGIPIAPFGAGSGVCGGTLPDPRTVIVDLKRMNRVRALDRHRKTVDVEAGAMGIRFEEDLVRDGFTLGHFPSSILCSTVGGWLAARSAGQCSGLYGKIEDMAVDLECVIAGGEIVRLKRRTRGPDLLPLMIGSEGVFGVITSSTLRIHDAPPSRTFGAFSFPSVEAGCETMREMFQAGLRPAVCRLYDAFDSWMAKRGSVKKDKEKRGSHEFTDAVLRKMLRIPKVLNGLVDRIGDKAFGGTLMVLVFEGRDEEGKDDLARATHVAARNAGSSLGEGPARHWFEHRYSVSYRQAPVFMAGAFSDTMEVAAPWSKLALLYESVRDALSKHVFVMAHFSHAYPDGASIYFTFAGSAETRAESEAKYDAAWRGALDAAIDAGGTLSHHHGVGRSKAPALGKELGLGVQVIQSLKRALDPRGIMNPGNLLPREPPSRPRAEERARPLAMDDISMLVDAPGESTLGSIEDLVRARGFTLRLDEGFDRTMSVASFIGAGCPGVVDPFFDPPDHAVAGFSATLRSGDILRIAPSPRRAVGPDLYALMHGTGERVGAMGRAHLRIHRTGLAARPLAHTIESNPPMDARERTLSDKLIETAAATSWRTE